MDERACISKQLKWNKFPFYGERLSRKIFLRGLTSPDSVSEKITQVEQTPLIRRQFVWRNHTAQTTEKQNTVKNKPGP